MSEQRVIVPVEPTKRRSKAIGVPRSEETKKKISLAQTKHGKIRSLTYKSWESMKSRCLCKTHKSYSNYGGRGIMVCDSWMRFENFYADMGERPAGTSLDRIDNNGNYEPGNCRWSTHSEQQNNKRTCVWLEHNGDRLNVSQWARKLGINRKTFIVRLKKNKTPDQIFMGKYVD